MTDGLKAPFPWFGGKSRVADVVWAAFGNVPNYVEPFAGSLAVMLARPHKAKVETANDKDGYISNFWRAVKWVPGEVAEWANWPVVENDLHARHIWIVAQKQDLVARLEGNPHFFDAKIAGWWVWGQCNWIGGEWCSGSGPWRVENEKLVRTENETDKVKRQIPHLADGGRGINRQLPHLGDGGRGISRQVPYLDNAGTGIQRRRVALSSPGRSAAILREEYIQNYMACLAKRLRHVRVCCGDWSRVISPSATTQHGITGMFLDPPYDLSLRDKEIYSSDEGNPASECLEWCKKNGDNPKLRIALCGYDGEHNALEGLGWRVHAWSSGGGYGSQGHGRGRENRHKERIWFSPECLTEDASAATLPLWQASAEKKP